MSDELLVSIIINNYNYACFLGDAIESALNQTYPATEVIVVDDGSTDNSRDIIVGYGDRITPVLKENGGQASAFNAGFARSRGEIIIFLDSDDLLLPDVVERVMAVFQTNPDVAKVQYRLEVIDAMGARTGVVKPPRHLKLPSGDLRQHVLTFPDDIPWLPTSGNAFAARVLREIFPVPENIYRICADYYLSNLPPLFGPVISLDEVGGYYRVHGSNSHYTSGINLDQTRQIIKLTCATHEQIKEFATRLGYENYPRDATDVLAVTFLAHRMVSLKLDPLQHPIDGDNILQLLRLGVSASIHRFDLSLPLKCLYLLWFVAMAPAPRSLVRWLAESFFHPEARGQFNKLLIMLQSARQNARFVG